MRPALIVAILLLAPRLASACDRDRETLAAESSQFPNLVRILTGRDERFPPLYYEMRLQRATKRVESNPDDLDAYDTAGVACDRLSRGEEAVRWM